MKLATDAGIGMGNSRIEEIYKDGKTNLMRIRK